MDAQGALRSGWLANVKVGNMAYFFVDARRERDNSITPSFLLSLFTRHTVRMDVGDSCNTYGIVHRFDTSLGTAQKSPALQDRRPRTPSGIMGANTDSPSSNKSNKNPTSPMCQGTIRGSAHRELCLRGGAKDV